jgi:hypothetical protein
MQATLKGEFEEFTSLHLRALSAGLSMALRLACVVALAASLRFCLAWCCHMTHLAFRYVYCSAWLLATFSSVSPGLGVVLAVVQIFSFGPLRVVFPLHVEVGVPWGGGVAGFGGEKRLRHR